MKREAIILVAGMGTRLKPLTLTNHKCLTKVNGKEIILNALDNLSKINVDRFILVVGYLAETIQKVIGSEYKGISVSYVENDIFDQTNTSYSLQLGLGSLKECEEVFVLEGDVFFSYKILQKLALDPHPNATLLEPYRKDLDGTFVDLRDGFVSDWTHKSMRGKNYVLENKFKTINIHKFQKKFVDNILLPCVTNMCSSKQGKEPLENVMKEIVESDQRAIYGVLSEGEKWFEIDDINDLHIAERIFSEER